ncbi:MAG: class I SAM-dependent methyltransferase [Deltaproteobacteria bacterium]|nr:class I SAM-dependent methyltransferase [Deltaproteobacteria bacterium]
MTKSDSFDTNAAAYDIWFDENQTIYQAELEAVKDFIPYAGAGVEIGMGTARFAAPLGIAIGVEPSPRMAELAKQRGVEVIEGVAEALPIADMAFDFALMVTVVCFFDNIASAFQEANRILKPKGVLIVGFIDRNSELGRQYSQRKKQSRFYKEAAFYSTSELETQLAVAGFADFIYRQTLFPGQSGVRKVENGHGKGSFIVVRAIKSRSGNRDRIQT